jgi:hypothetical protein
MITAAARRAREKRKISTRKCKDLDRQSPEKAKAMARKSLDRFLQ